MTKKTAQIIFMFFNFLAVPAVGYGIYDYISISSAIDRGEINIPFDSGVYYLFLMSIFWVLSVIQRVGLKDSQQQAPKYSNHFVIAWFIVMMLLANILPYSLQQKFEQLGYLACDDPKEISRTSRGERSIYSKQLCP